MLRELIQHLQSTICFDKYYEKVREYNRKALGLYLIFGLFASLAGIAGEFLILRTVNFIPVILFAVYFLVCLFIYWKHAQDSSEFATLYLYLLQLPVVAMAIYMGTKLNPEAIAVTFMIVMIAMPPFILDRPWRVILYILGIAIAFAIADASVKTGTVLLHDLLHLLVYTCVSIGTTIYVLENRIVIVEKSQTFLQDSEHDPLTGIYNRRGGEEKIKTCVNNKIGGLFLILDVDDFKHVNDTYGHTMGDEILNAVSMVLASSFRATDIVMRMGGDEFIVYAPGLTNYFFIDGKLQQLNEKMRNITCQNGRDNISVSIGAVINDGSYPNYEELFNEADSILYEVKSTGKNSFRLQDRPYSVVHEKNEFKEQAAKARAEREAASEAEEAKYRK